MAKHLLAIDQGTTGSTAIVVTLEGETLGKKNVEFAQHFPQPGWVEHDPEAIWTSVGAAVGRFADPIAHPPERVPDWDGRVGTHGSSSPQL